MSITVGANTLVVTGFYLNMCGIRRFYGAPTKWAQALALVGGSSLVMVCTFSLWYGRNPIYTAAQALPLLLTTIYLVGSDKRELGAIVSSAAMIAGCIAHGVIAFGNTLIVTGLAPELQLRDAASIDLLVFLFAGVVWNFGFLMSAVDRLRGEVERLANEDELTGLANRRRFMARLTKTSAESTKAATFSLMLFDLDHFKAINDRHGHAAGDAALQHTANVIRNVLSKNDVFARFGGDEFALLLPHAGPVKAAKIAEKIVEALTKAPLNWKGAIVPITASIGIEAVQGAAPKAEAVLEAADRALYQTKRQGRNGYTLFQDAQRSRQVLINPIDRGIRSKRAEEKDSARCLA